MALPLFLKPKNLYHMKRLGKNNDGGYLCGINSINETKTLISFGINDDFSFEKDFSILNQNAKIICYDNNNYKIFWLKYIWKDIGKVFFNFNIKSILKTIFSIVRFNKFFKKNKLIQKRITYNSLNDILIDEKDIILKPLFLKIDIEGGEYRILESILKIQHLINGIIIELHDIDLHMEKIKYFVDKLKLNLIHIHGNNFSELESKNPTVIEVTFERNSEIIPSEQKYPNDLDQPNNSEKKDICLTFE